MSDATWAKAWKKAARDWRRIAIRRGIRFRSRDAHKEIVNLQFYNLRTMCIKSRILVNAIKRNDRDAIDRATRQLDQLIERMYDFMGEHDMPWNDRD